MAHRVDSETRSASQDVEILVVNTKSNDISFIDARTDEATATLAVGGGPRDAAWAPATGRLFVALGEAGEVAVVDPAARNLIRKVSVGLRPLHVYHHPVEPEIWVGNDGSGTISVLHDLTGEEVATISVGDGHHKIAFTPDGRVAFCTNIRSAAVTMIDAIAHSALLTIGVGRAPHGLAVTADGRFVLVANNGDDAVSVIEGDRGEVVGEVPCVRPNYIAITEDGRQAWVVCLSGHVIVIDLESMRVVETIPVGQAPDRIVFRPGGDIAFVNNTHSDSVSVMNARTLKLIDTVQVEAGGSHQGMAFDFAGMKLYVANYVAGSVSVLAASQPHVLKRIAVGQGPAAVVRLDASGSSES